MLINSLNEYNNEIEYKINKCNTETECKLSSVVMTVEKMSQNIDEHQNKVDFKINEIENNCKTEIQAVNESIDVISKKSIQSEDSNDKKLYSLEQTISSMRDELSVVRNQSLNNVTERIFMTRDTNNEIELETFSSENRRIHPMQFLNRTREFNRFNSSSWKVKLLKILKCFKGSAEIWAEVHNVEWGSYEDFEAAFRNKCWSEEDQEILRSKIMGNGNFGRMNIHLTIYVMTIYILSLIHI